MINLRKLIISLLIPLSVGGLSALITMGDMKNYSDIIKPSFSPPGFLFPIVWTLLFILMGISLYLVWESDKDSFKTVCFSIFAFQLIINFIWSPIFFSAKAYLPSFFVLVVLWVSILAMIICFWKVSKTAALLQIPYLLWVTFAGVLNISIYLLNR